jgi:TPR repeat protein
MGNCFTEEIKFNYVEHHTKLANVGNLDSIKKLALYYKNQNDKSKMKHYYNLGIELNDMNCMISLGEYYQKEDINPKLMKKFYDLAIEKHQSDVAFYNLGVYYFEAENFNLAKKLFEKSANLGNTCAMIEVGRHHKKNGNFDSMKKYFEMAVESDDPEGYNELGIFYLQQNNRDEGFAYLTRGAELNNTNCMVSLGTYYYDQTYLTDNPTDYYTLAIEHYKNAVKVDNNMNALNKLGMHYEKVVCDYETAINYYLTAIKLGSVDAIYNLACYYVNIDKNMLKGMEYFLKIKYDKIKESDYFDTYNLCLHKIIQKDLLSDLIKMLHCSYQLEPKAVCVKCITKDNLVCLNCLDDEHLERHTICRNCLKSTNNINNICFGCNATIDISKLQLINFQ